MSGGAAASSSSSCSATFSSSSNHSTKAPSSLSTLISSPSLTLHLNPRNRLSRGFRFVKPKRVVSDSFFVVVNTKCSTISRRGLEIAARAAGAAKTIEVEVDKPLGLSLGQKSGGCVVITDSDDFLWELLLRVKAFFCFGILIWVEECMFNSSMSSSGGADVDVKRLRKRPAPPRFGI